MEQKKYTINNKVYIDGKLLWIQRHLISNFERKLREKIVSLYNLQPKDTDKEPDIAKVFEISIDLDQLFFSDENELLTFLGTILVREGEKFDEAKIPDYAADMKYIAEDDLGEVIQNFFARTRKPLGVTSSVPSKPGSVEQQ